MENLSTLFFVKLSRQKIGVAFGFKVQVLLFLLYIQLRRMSHLFLLHNFDSVALYVIHVITFMQT